MTYCVGMLMDRGLVLMSDTRTNSGVDNISVFKKMHCWSVPDERIIGIMTAGNLATTQRVVSLLEERQKAKIDRHPTLLEAPTMFEVAQQVGILLRDTIELRPDGGHARTNFSASIIVAGQIKGGDPRVFMIYPEGNFIEATPDTPFFQIGEAKYGRPILVRGYDRAMSFEDAIKLVMVSFDSTIAANLSVGLPLDLLVMEKDNFEPLHARRVMASDPYYQAISQTWGEAMRDALESLPPYSLDGDQKGGA
jgi:putative proteasome-type protease